jgi:hypothetical protein
MPPERRITMQTRTIKEIIKILFLPDIPRRMSSSADSMFVATLGSSDGAIEDGAIVGATLGHNDGMNVGLLVEGVLVGVTEGVPVVGYLVGVAVDGAKVGAIVGLSVGADGTAVGINDGAGEFAAIVTAFDSATQSTLPFIIQEYVWPGVIVPG